MKNLWHSLGRFSVITTDNDTPCDIGLGFNKAVILDYPNSSDPANTSLEVEFYFLRSIITFRLRID